MNLINLYSENALELPFYEKVISNITNILKTEYDFIIVGEANGLKESLPVTKSKKIVFSFADEGNRVPRYTQDDSVFLIFKNYVPHLILDKVKPIPLPIPKNILIKNIPFEQRGIDVFFSGQLANDIRRQTFSQLERLKTQFPNLVFNLNKTDGFGKGFSPKEYSDLLCNSKSVICPPGGNVETFRFTEALAAGCVVLAPEMLNYWYYQKSPHIRIGSSRDIEYNINFLFSNPSLLNKIHSDSLLHYKNNFSVEAVSQYCISEIVKKEINK